MNVVIPFAVIDSINPNVRIASYKEQLNVYYKCIEVALATFRKFNPHLNLTFFTNVNPPIETSRFLDSIDVNTVLSPYTYIPPKRFGPRFKGCFYLLDAIAHFKDSTLFVDPDVICVRNIEFEMTQFGSSFFALDLAFDSNKFVNGMTPQQSAITYRKMQGIPEYVHKHLGGELLYIPKESCQNLIQEIQYLWSLRNRLEFKEIFFRTEEHLLSAIISAHGFKSLSSFGLRIWTARTYRAAEGGEFDPKVTSLWHLPGEKNSGFQEFWQFIRSQPERFLSIESSDFLDYALKCMNIRLGKIAVLEADILRLIKSFLNYQPASAKRVEPFL